MIDEIYDRSFQAGRADLNKGILALAHKVRDAVQPALSGVYHFEWDAPWKANSNTQAKA